MTTKHCWHPTGDRFTNGMGTEGAIASICCRCGHFVQRIWKLGEERPLDGHGPFYVLPARIFNPIETACEPPE